MANTPAKPDYSNKLSLESRSAESKGTKRTSAEIVASELGWRIMVQQYPPGSRLREQELSSEFGVSRTVIRDVIGKMAARGLVEIHPWRGAAVVNYNPEELADLLELNAVVYGMVARHAAERRTPENIANMERILEMMTELADATDSPEDFHVTRVEFFGVLNRSTLSFFTGRVRANFPLTFYHQHVLADARTPELRLRQVEFFREVLQHLRDGASQAAQDCVYRTFMEKRAIVMQSLEAETEAETVAVA
jgi:DNA-binding GntR family transcriptional regulator